MKYGEILFQVILLLMIFRFIYILIRNLNVKSSIMKAIKKSELNSNKRKEEYDLLVERYGALEKLKFRRRVDMKLFRSGLKEKFTFLNAEIYFLIMALVGVIVFFICQLFLINKVISIGFGIIGALSLYLLLYILTNITYEKVDNQIMIFLNILDNFATSTDDIVSIFQQTSSYVQYPLNKYCEEFVAESKTSGNLKMAFNNLEDKIENAKLKDIIKNLEISSRNDANYKEILDKSKEVMKRYFDNKENTRSAKKSGQFEIVLCLAMGFLMIFMLKGIVPSLFKNLATTSVGNVILIYCIAVAIICFWNFISLQKN